MKETLLRRNQRSIVSICLDYLLLPIRWHRLCPPPDGISSISPGHLASSLVLLRLAPRNCEPCNVTSCQWFEVMVLLVMAHRAERNTLPERHFWYRQTRHQLVIVMHGTTRLSCTPIEKITQTLSSR